MLTRGHFDHDGLRFSYLDRMESDAAGETSHGGIHSVEAYCDDIDALLANRGVTGPVVILGHSFGGMHASIVRSARQDAMAGAAVALRRPLA